MLVNVANCGILGGFFVVFFTHAPCIVWLSLALLFKADYSGPDGPLVPMLSLSVLQLLPLSERYTSV